MIKRALTIGINQYDDAAVLGSVASTAIAVWFLADLFSSALSGR